MTGKFAIGVDVGGQSSKIGIVKENGEIIARKSFKYEKGINYVQYLNNLTNIIKELVEDKISKDQIIGIGVGTPNGNFKKGTIEFAPNLPWAKDINGTALCLEFAKDLEELTKIRVVLTNDANAAAMGEMIYGGAQGIKDFIMITLGTGVGSGIVIDGKVLYGNDGFAGELGHIVAIRNGRQCSCGLKGCLETYCSAIGVARTTEEFLAKYPEKKTMLRGIVIDNETSIKVCQAAEAGDELAIEIFKYTGKILGESFATFVSFSAPKTIFLFGGLTKSAAFMLDSINKNMNDNLLDIWKNKVDIRLSQLPDSDAAILGASALVY